MLRTFLTCVKNHKGQALVEFALVVTLLLTLTFGVIEFGRIFNQMVTVNQAAREAARAIAVAPNFTTARAAATAYGNNLTVVFNPSTPVNGNRPVMVTVTSDVPLITPLVSQFFRNADTFTVTGQATMISEY